MKYPSQTDTITMSSLSVGEWEDVNSPRASDKRTVSDVDTSLSHTPGQVNGTTDTLTHSDKGSKTRAKVRPPRDAFRA